MPAQGTPRTWAPNDGARLYDLSTLTTGTSGHPFNLLRPLLWGRAYENGEWDESLLWLGRFVTESDVHRESHPAFMGMGVSDLAE